MMKPTYLTKEGIQRIENELRQIKDVKRPDIVRKIAHARSLGDLSENAEYHAAKEELIRLERKIFQLETTLSRARVVDKNDIQIDQVRLLTRAVILNETRGTEIEYTLVSPEEADPINRKISIDSPVGKALMNRKVDDKIEVKVPSGTQKLIIKEILPPE
jgi:transcription elongation factor GreA